MVGDLYKSLMDKDGILKAFLANKTVVTVGDVREGVLGVSVSTQYVVDALARCGWIINGKLPNGDVTFAKLLHFKFAGDDLEKALGRKILPVGDICEKDVVFGSREADIFDRLCRFLKGKETVSQKEIYNRIKCLKNESSDIVTAYMAWCGWVLDGTIVFHEGLAGGSCRYRNSNADREIEVVKKKGHADVFRLLYGEPATKEETLSRNCDDPVYAETRKAVARFTAELERTQHNDPVAEPSHYKQHPSGIECITITRHMNFNLGNAVKYVWRAGLKNSAIEDLRKAVWYLNDEIARLESSKK